MKDEILKVLKMVEEGKLSSEKALEMIMLICERVEHNKKVKGRILRISVDSSSDDTVRVNIPLDFLKNMIKAMGPEYIQKMIKKYAKIDKFSSQSQEGNEVDFAQIPEGIDFNFLLYAIENDLEGEIVSVQSQDSKVHIVIE